MYKRGDSATNVMMFIAAMMAVIIGSTWVLKSHYPFQRDLVQVEQELAKLQLEFSTACSTAYYVSRYNPAVDSGLLSIRDSEICINSNLCSKFQHNYTQCTVLPGIFRCRPLICNTGVYQDIDLKQITYIYIIKNDTISVATE